jgi:predicted ester cyclase
MTAEQNKTTYREFVEVVLNQGRLDRVEQFLEPQFADNTPHPETMDDFTSWLQAFRQAFPDARWDIDVLLAEGDLLAHRKTLRGTHRGEYRGLAPTGRRITLSETVIVRFANGKMVEFWGEYDDSRVLAQLDG